jgi:hypothetical protein
MIVLPGWISRPFNLLIPMRLDVNQRKTASYHIGRTELVDFGMGYKIRISE